MPRLTLSYLGGITAELGGVSLAGFSTDKVRLLLAFLEGFSLAEARSALGEEAFAILWNEGVALNFEQALAYALEVIALPVEGAGNCANRQKLLIKLS